MTGNIQRIKNIIDSYKDMISDLNKYYQGEENFRSIKDVKNVNTAEHIAKYPSNIMKDQYPVTVQILKYEKFGSIGTHNNHRMAMMRNLYTKSEKQKKQAEHFNDMPANK